MAEMKFEEALHRLEEIVETLEKGELELAKSLEMFEEGVKLARWCTRKLDEANKKIEMLTRDEEGKLFAQPFPEAGEE